MSACAICHLAIEESPLVDRETGSAFHPACAARRVPVDLGVALLAVVAAVVLPTVVVWAG